MPRTAKDPRPEPRSRYGYEKACAEIEKVLDRKGRGSRKDAATALGLKAPQFSKRMGATWEIGERFRVEDFGTLADWAKAPPGWPFIPWDEGDQMERDAREWRRLKRGGKG